MIEVDCGSGGSGVSADPGQVTGDKGERTQQKVMNRIYRVVPGATVNDLQVGG